jgi:hypothetical protein
MANKTAMQQMLEWTRKTFPMDLDTPRMIEDKIESLLKVEEEEHRKIASKAREDGWKEGKYGVSRW